MIRREDALAYHRQGRPGKLEVVATKPVQTQRDLSLAYSPGVAEPCREIADDRNAVGLYTARRNLVAVVSNGTAVLGLGNIGPYAAKPVMEGKAVLFKRYADIDVFDIEVNAEDPDQFIEVVAALEPTFGGINLEDIKAPDCFKVERSLEQRMNIPVFHDDQHGTAIISAAALLNAAVLQEKSLEEIQVVCVGAGAAAISCMHLWARLGVKQQHILMTDSKGVLNEGRDAPMEPYRSAFAQPASDRRRSLEDAMKGADVVVGLATAGLITEKMVASMGPRPIIFALANPDPEIPFEVAKRVRPDALIGTGRSDYPNQVNNVLGFPYIFRGALDVGATHINEEMKTAAVHALAELAREGVPESVLNAYGGRAIKFGPDYVIPKPVDERALSWVASAVAKAAIDSGVATLDLDHEQYREQLNRKLSPTRRVMWHITQAAKTSLQRIVYPEGETDAILRAARIVRDDQIAQPIVLGRPEVIRDRLASLGLDSEGIEIIPSDRWPRLDQYADVYWRMRQRKGETLTRALSRLTQSRTHYAMLMVHQGEADGLVSGMNSAYATTIRPALKIIGVRSHVKRAAGMYMVVSRDEVKFLADTTVNIDPDEETLAETAILSADFVRDLGIEPRVAMLSFSNFGDAPHASSRKVARATERVKALRPELMIDGEMQADIALLPEARQTYPFTTLKDSANVLIFPNLDAGNIAYKMLAAEGATVIGPFVLGMKRPVNVAQQGASVDTIVHITSITAARSIRLKQMDMLEPYPA
ncbi:MAG: NADP-dependent malic enzyme [Myxococcota bacterium]